MNQLTGDYEKKIEDKKFIEVYIFIDKSLVGYLSCACEVSTFFYIGFVKNWYR